MAPAATAITIAYVTRGADGVAPGPVAGEGDSVPERQGDEGVAHREDEDGPLGQARLGAARARLRQAARDERRHAGEGDERREHGGGEDPRAVGLRRPGGLLEQPDLEGEDPIDPDGEQGQRRDQAEAGGDQLDRGPGAAGQDGGDDQRLERRPTVAPERGGAPEQHGDGKQDGDREGVGTVDEPGEGHERDGDHHELAPGEEGRGGLEGHRPGWYVGTGGCRRGSAAGATVRRGPACPPPRRAGPRENAC